MPMIKRKKNSVLLLKMLFISPQFSISLNIGYMLEEQTSCPTLDFQLAVFIFEPKQDEAVSSVHLK